MLNAIKLLDSILNSDNNKEPVQYALGFIETVHAILAIEEYDINVDIPLSKSINFMVKEKDIHEIIERAKQSHAVLDIYITGPTKSILLLTDMYQFNLRPVKHGKADTIPWTVMPYREYPNLQFVSSVLLLNALSQATAGNLEFVKLYAFLLCYTVAEMGRVSIIDQVNIQIKACKDRGVPIYIHFEMVRQLVEQMPEEKRVTELQVAYMAQVITQKYAPLERPYNDLMLKLMSQ